jgi:hypothetical protein
MENTPYLYDTLLGVLGQHSKWLDRRHRQTLAWMMLGLICSKTVSLGTWIPFVVSRAHYAQSTVRRFSRWLNNNRIKPQPLYGPLIEQGLRGWIGKRIYIALDTSMLWNIYCMIRLSVIYRGRAVPLVWKVIEHVVQLFLLRSIKTCWKSQRGVCRLPVKLFFWLIVALQIPSS